MARYIDADLLVEELLKEIEFESSMYTEEQNKCFMERREVKLWQK